MKLKKIEKSQGKQKSSPCEPSVSYLSIPRSAFGFHFGKTIIRMSPFEYPAEAVRTQRIAWFPRLMPILISICVVFAHVFFLVYMLSLSIAWYYIATHATELTRVKKSVTRILAIIILKQQLLRDWSAWHAYTALTTNIRRRSCENPWWKWYWQDTIIWSFFPNQCLQGQPSRHAVIRVIYHSVLVKRKWASWRPTLWTLSHASYSLCEHHDGEPLRQASRVLASKICCQSWKNACSYCGQDNTTVLSCCFCEHREGQPSRHAAILRNPPCTGFAKI